MVVVLHRLMNFDLSDFSKTSAGKVDGFYLEILVCFASLATVGGCFLNVTMSKPSKKSGRKKSRWFTGSWLANLNDYWYCSSKAPPAAIIQAHLADMSDNICSVTGHDSNLLASQASKILALASNESKKTSIIYFSSSPYNIRFWEKGINA